MNLLNDLLQMSVKKRRENAYSKNREKKKSLFSIESEFPFCEEPKVQIIKIRDSVGKVRYR